MIKELNDCPIVGQFVFYEDENDKFKGINAFHKAFWYVNDGIEDIVTDLIYDYKQEHTIRNSSLEIDYTNCMTVIVCNVIRLMTSKKQYIRISLNSNNFKANKRVEKYEPIKITYTVFNNLITWLAQNDYINLYKGEANPIIKLGSLIEPLDKLKDLCLDFNYTSVDLHPDYSLVQLKDEAKNLIDYEDSEETIYRNKVLKQYNKFLNKNQIKIDNELISYPITLESKFNREIGLNGRIFGGDWMNCKSELRETITIDDKDTVELDYSNCALRLAAHLNGIDVEVDKDLYDIKETKHVRVFVKRVATRSFNIKASSIQDLANKVTNSIYVDFREGASFVFAKSFERKNNATPEETKRYRDSVEDDIKLNENNFEYLLNKYGIPWDKPTLKAEILIICNELYKLAGDYLLNGRGMELQYMDSKICFRIIEQFLELNKPLLTIHDSFVVEKEDKELLRDIMTKSYEEVVGYKPKIK